MINHMTIQGRFTRQPELKRTSTDLAVCNFTLAWSEKYGEKETTLFLNCVAYRSTAEFVSKYFLKGDMAVVEGKLTSRSYEKDNEKRYITELIVDKVHFCGSKDKSNNETTNNNQPGLYDIDPADDLPF